MLLRHEGPMLETTILSVLAVHRPFYISICRANLDRWSLKLYISCLFWHQSSMNRPQGLFEFYCKTASLLRIPYTTWQILQEGTKRYRKMTKYSGNWTETVAKKPKKQDKFSVQKNIDAAEKLGCAQKR